MKVSTPEHFYDQLEAPSSADERAALQELSAIVGIDPSVDVFGLHTWDKIAEAMVTHESAVTVTKNRGEAEIGRHVLDLLERYPWLQKVCGVKSLGEEELTPDSFFRSVSNHAYDDRPGLYGITEREGMMLRGAVEATARNDSRETLARELGFRE